MAANNCGDKQKSQKSQNRSRKGKNREEGQGPEALPSKRHKTQEPYALNEFANSEDSHEKFIVSDRRTIDPQEARKVHKEYAIETVKNFEKRFYGIEESQEGARRENSL